MRLKLLVNRCLLTCVAALTTLSSDAFTVDGFEFAKIAYNEPGKNQVALMGVTIPDSGEVIVPSKVEYEGVEYLVTVIAYGFSNSTTLKSVVFPETIISYAESMFYKCTSLTSVKFPDNCTEIPIGTFAYCSSLKSIELPPNIKSIRSSAFVNCTSLEEVNIPESVTVIGNGAFAFCSSLKQIHSSSVLTIEGYAFQTCTSLTNVDFPNVETIGQYAFAHCNELKTATFGEKIKSIGNRAFKPCQKLELITLNATTPPSAVEIPSDGIYGTFDTWNYQNTGLHVPMESIEEYKKADVWKNFFTEQDNPLTGIEGVEAEGDNEVVGWYDLYGRSVTEDYRGVVIVRYADGTTSKEVRR